MPVVRSRFRLLERNLAHAVTFGVGFGARYNVDLRGVLVLVSYFLCDRDRTHTQRLPRPPSFAHRFEYQLFPGWEGIRWNRAGGIYWSEQGGRRV